MKNTTKKAYTLDGQTVSHQKFFAVKRANEKAKKNERKVKKSSRQKERRSEQRVVRSSVFGSIPWVRGNPPKFGTKAASKLKGNKAYAFHVAIRVSGDISQSRGLGAIRDWYGVNASNDFEGKAKNGEYTIYPFLGNFTPEEMAMIPAGDTRTNAEIRIQAVITDLVDRGADSVDSRGVFVSGVMGGGKGLR